MMEKLDTFNGAKDQSAFEKPLFQCVGCWPIQVRALVSFVCVS